MDDYTMPTVQVSSQVRSAPRCDTEKGLRFATVHKRITQLGGTTYIWCITYISGRMRARKGIEESIRLLRHHESEVSILSGLGCSLVHVLSLNCKETGKMNSFPCKPQRTRSRMKSGPEIKM